MKALSVRRGSVQELQQQPTHPIGLLLLDPVAGAVDEVYASDPRARALLHAVEGTWILIGPPVALAGHDHGRLIDGPSGKDLQVRVEPPARSDAIGLRAALKTGS